VQISALASAPSNMVTTDTTQTISGYKTFSGGLKVPDGIFLEVGSSGSAGISGDANNNIDLTPSGAGMVRALGPFQATHARATGLTGALSAVRWVGGTASGAPSSGTFVVGDWVVTQNGHIFVCTVAGTPGTWVDAGSYGSGGGGATLAANTFTGVQTAPAFSSSGLTGATSGSRFVGATAGGAPASGTFVVGDFIIDRASGCIMVCTVAGSPGTWVDAATGSHTGSLTMSGVLTGQVVAASGLTGATTASRYVGAVAGVDGPASGTFSVGDWVVGTGGTISVCTVAGTPGTWVSMYSDGNAPESLMLTERAAAPSTPASGKAVMYVLSGDSKPYVINDAGRVSSLEDIEAYTFSVTGTVAVATGKSRIYLEGSYVIETVRAAVNTAPTGAALIVDVNKNGTTIYTTQTARPQIAAAGFTATGNSPAVTTFAAGDYITVDVDQVGSTVAGADLTVTIRLRRVG
jgi:hypothetical protein